MSFFSTFGNILGRPLSWFVGASESTSSTNNVEEAEEEEDHDSEAVEPDDEDEDEDVEPYEPSILDVLVVKAMLNKAVALPPELLNTILDQAEYWPHSTAEWSGGPLSIFGGRRDREDVFLVRNLTARLLLISGGLTMSGQLRSIPLGFTRVPDDPHLPLDFETTPVGPDILHRQHSLETFQEAINSPSPLLEHPCRKIVFTIRSHDQGWGGDPRHQGTYEGSWTWFDAGLEKFDAGEETEVQTAGRRSSFVSAITGVIMHANMGHSTEIDPDKTPERMAASPSRAGRRNPRQICLPPRPASQRRPQDPSQRAGKEDVHRPPRGMVVDRRYRPLRRRRPSRAAGQGRTRHGHGKRRVCAQPYPR